MSGDWKHVADKSMGEFEVLNLDTYMRSVLHAIECSKGEVVKCTILLRESVMLLVCEASVSVTPDAKAQSLYRSGREHRRSDYQEWTDSRIDVRSPPERIVIERCEQLAVTVCGQTGEFGH